jgi:putative FmdB family regulatory protein
MRASRISGSSKDTQVPLYEYRCKNCGHVFEKIQSFSAPEEKECPVCQGPVEKLLSAPAVQFKGSGWYVTDYAGKSAGSSKSSGDSSAKPASGSAEKPAAAASDNSSKPASAPSSAPSKSD